ncbi:MAG: hypothetical protein KUG77_12690 [Nannocystaceae bacterium]|nr:hypothetical protein [Nannocystaceae bacterium]
MRRWLWIPVVLLTGCFSEPDASGVPESDGGTTTDSMSSGADETVTTGGDSTGPSRGADESTGSTDGPTSSTTTARDPVCGDGVVEGSEHCDGDDPQGAACLDDCTITCLDHFDDCDKMPLTGCEIDTATDDNNCGACGHICSSGVCHDSTCAPAPIAEGIGPGPTRIIRIGDTFVFDESGFGRILRWDLGDGAVQELVSDDLTGSFQRFAVVDGAVHWLDRNLSAAQRVPLTGPPVEFMFAIEDGGSPFASNTHLYYPTTAFEGGVQVSTLLEATHGAPSVTTAIATDVPGSMCQVVVAAGRVIWTGTDFEDPIRSVPVGGGPIQSHPVLSTDACNRPVFGVGPTIYLYGRALEAGPFGLIAHNIASNTSSMVIQEAGLGDLRDYFVSADGILADVGGEIRAYDLLGADPVVVADLTPGSMGRYLDEQVVMWTELEGNTWTLFVAERP